jgi:hypothetical protein
MRAHMLKTMHVVRFQPSGGAGTGPGWRSLAGEASRAVTELDSERSRGVSSATVGEVAELSSSCRRGLKVVIVSVVTFTFDSDVPDAPQRSVEPGYGKVNNPVRRTIL